MRFFEIRMKWGTTVHSIYIVIQNRKKLLFVFPIRGKKDRFICVRYWNGQFYYVREHALQNH